MYSPATALTIALALGLATLAMLALWLLEVKRREQLQALEREQLLHEQRVAAIGAMAAGVVRDIGNPIAAIDGYARALVDAQQRGEIAPPPAPLYDPALIVGEATRLVAITREISELASAAATQRELVNVNEAVTHAIALLRYEPRLERVLLRTELDPQLPATAAVAERLVVLVTQLVTDALDAGSRVICVATRRDGDAIEIEVTGDRAGPPPDLALARTIAQAHGGVIKIKSSAGRGTCVRARIAIAPLN